ncbi:MAG: hypothetical protein AAFO88_02875, partial [Pseudomonadota bacterium]
MGIQRNTCRNGGRIEIGRRGVLLGLAGASIAAGCQPMPLAEDVPGGAWRKGVALPLAVQEIYPALHAGRIHVAGGFVAENGAITGPTDAHFAFDPITEVWEEQPALPMARHHPHLVSFHGRLIALGGFESPAPDRVWVMQSGVWMRHPEDDRFVDYPPFEDAGQNWAKLTDLPRPVGEAVTAVIGNRLHLAGGRRPAGETNASWSDHTDASDHFVLTSRGGQWETAAPMPTARNSAAGAMIGEDWHVVGGRTVSGGNTIAHEVYDARE